MKNYKRTINFLLGSIPYKSYKFGDSNDSILKTDRIANH